MGELPRRHDRFDLYLDRGCRSFPLVADLVPSMRALADAEVQRQLTAREPRWLGLSLPAAEAETLARRLVLAGAWGEIVAAAYRTPRLTQEAARTRAAQVLPGLTARDFPGYTDFKPPVLRRDQPRWYLFITVSDRLLAEGHIPGGALAAIDKLDGHLWREEDLLLLAQRRIERLEPRN